MSERIIITIQQISECYGIEPELIREFADFGLYPVVSQGGESGIENQYLDRVERIISLYRSLGVNKEGIDIILELREEISRLQGQVEELQREAQKIKSLLGYEDPETLRTRGLFIEIDD